jgi:hypothetical protein
MKSLVFKNFVLLILSFTVGNLVFAQDGVKKDDVSNSTAIAEIDLNNSWKIGATACYMNQDGFGKESNPYCYEVLKVDDGNVQLGFWRGASKDRPENGPTGSQNFIFDKSTALVGYAGFRGLRYKPYETIGCLPIQNGRNCLESLTKPFMNDVDGVQFPQWRTNELKEARYAEKSEKYTLADGTVIEALRFTARFRRNDGGEYIRQALYRADGTSAMPLAWLITYYNSTASGPKESGHMSKEFFQRKPK